MLDLIHISCHHWYQWALAKWRRVYYGFSLSTSLLLAYADVTIFPTRHQNMNYLKHVQDFLCNVKYADIVTTFPIFFMWNINPILCTALQNFLHQAILITLNIKSVTKYPTSSTNGRTFTTIPLNCLLSLLSSTASLNCRAAIYH